MQCRIERTYEGKLRHRGEKDHQGVLKKKYDRVACSLWTPKKKPAC